VVPIVHGLDVMTPAHLNARRHVHRLVMNFQPPGANRMRSPAIAQQHRVIGQRQRGLQTCLAHFLQHLAGDQASARRGQQHRHLLLGQAPPPPLFRAGNLIPAPHVADC